MMPPLQEIADTINDRSNGRVFGSLQIIRSRINGLKNVSKKIFHKIRSDDWTFHYGGRSELQFNIGFQEFPDGYFFRYGVAFSLQTSQSVPDIDLMLPKIEKFNDYVDENSEDFSDLNLWINSINYIGKASKIEVSNFTEGNFIFCGKFVKVENIDYEDVMNLFDRMLPLYVFVQSSGELIAASAAASSLGLRDGWNNIERFTSRTAVERVLDVHLLHNEIQVKLCEELISEYGANSIALEYPSPAGSGRIDIFVDNGKERIIFEIKTASTARSCIREALGQLVEYGCWPNGGVATRLVVVGSPELTDIEINYLKKLNEHFKVPIHYQRVCIV